MNWIECDTGLNLADKNMAIDCHLFGNLSQDKRPVLHFYDFPEKSATYGHFIKPSQLFSEKFLMNFDLARRPTGGGFLFHGSDFTFSILVPESHSFYSQNPLESYNKINQVVLKAVQEVCKDSFSLFIENDKASSPHENFCLAKPTIYDIFLNGQKIGGSAERRVRFGLLHQASINLLSISKTPYYSLLEESYQDLAKAMKKNSNALLTSIPSENEANLLKSSLKALLRKNLFQIN